MTRRPCFVNEAIDRIVIEQHWTGNWKILKRPKLIAGGGNRNEVGARMTPLHRPRVIVLLAGIWLLCALNGASTCSDA